MAQVVGWRRKREDFRRTDEILAWFNDGKADSPAPAWLADAAASNKDAENALDQLRATKDHRSRADVLTILGIIGAILSILNARRPKQRADVDAAPTPG